MHKISLVKTIERYIHILPKDPARCKKHLEMYEHTLENHNRVCDLHNSPEERIRFVIEKNSMWFR